MRKKNIFIFGFLLVIVVGFFTVCNVFKSVDTLDFAKNSVEGTTETTGEIVAGTIIHQEFPRVYKKMEGVRLQFANYSNRNNKGNIQVKVYEDELQIADVNLDASKIKDGEFVNIPFQKKNGRIGSKLSVDITSNDGQSGSAVTLWMAENKSISILGSELQINDQSVSKSLNLQLDYFSPKVNNMVWIVLFLLCWLTIPTGMLAKFSEKYQSDGEFYRRVNRVLCSIGVVVLGVLLLSLRDLSFVSSPTLYAEDAAYLSNIFEHGFLNTIFMTRGGGSADFQNSGSYILLFLALKTTNLFYGYDLSSLPIFIGVYANLFWSLVAFSGYTVFRSKGKLTAISVFLTIVLISMGSSGGEVFGRVLNTVFIWPLLTTFLLMLQYKNRYNLGARNILIGLACIIAGLSFPVSYGIVGIYLIFSFIRAMREKKFKAWFASDWLILICLAIGVGLLPTIMSSEGITGTMTLNPDSIFEFVFARHILYPFIQLFYGHLNDKITAVLFMAYACIILYAGFLYIKKKGFLNSYVFFICCTVGVVFSSALMRIKMTELFNEYQSTSPDRYFYGCNAFCVLALLYALYIILTEKKVNKNLTAGVISLVLIGSVANPFLFELTSPNLSIRGAQDFGTFEDGVVKAVNENRLDEDVTGYVTVTVYPIIKDGEWIMYIPVRYALATIN